MKKYFWSSFIPANLIFFASIISQGATNQQPLKVVLQMTSATQQVVMRGMRDALEISDESHKHGQPLDLRLVVCGPAADQFLKGMSLETKKSHEELFARSDIHLYVCEPTLKRIGKELKDMLPGFTLVASGAFEVLRLEQQGYLYLKP